MYQPVVQRTVYQPVATTNPSTPPMTPKVKSSSNAENGGNKTKTVFDYHRHQHAIQSVKYPSFQQYHRNVNRRTSYPLHPAHHQRRPQPGHQRRRNRPRQIKSKLSHENDGETHTRKRPNLKYNDDHKLRKKRSVAYDEDEENEAYDDEDYDEENEAYDDEGYDEREETEESNRYDDNYEDRQLKKNRAMGYDHGETEALDSSFLDNGSVRYGHRSNDRMGKCLLLKIRTNCP